MNSIEKKDFPLACIIIVIVAAACVVLAVVIGAIPVTTPEEPDLPMIFFVYNLDREDHSYTDTAYRGLIAAQEDMDFRTREFATPDFETLSPQLATPDPERPGLVITVGYIFADLSCRLADENPDVMVLAIDQPGPGSENMRSYEITSYGSSYLAGVLAASATETDRVGIILGTQSDLLEGFRRGYLEGVYAINPAIIVDQEYVRDNSPLGFADPDRAGTIASGMYEGGTDVIYAVAGLSGTGVIHEAKQHPGRYVIGVDSDQTPLGPEVVLGSAVKRVDRVVYSGIREYMDGTLSGGETIAGFDEGMTGLVFNPKYSSFEPAVSEWEESARDAEARYRASREHPTAVF
ncbi:MAG TPA: BMP family ABC transporter substrate-binding protein [Methanoregulaceae archaeon]|nr:BMP family ABC transporter substrate-binding protein [Methanolinea sp.]HOP67899.1 BMP family ABC transporter substrate-binding protein [Methanoregulaceae archaeon]HPJ74398.1 BMP family ABC transporter substrate-binding protein [Methanoregulaceae archaeon]HPQ75865.1 BMP family ABC transporter substrate-binding protein [Methanoregulaceae archaeon]HQC12281.1 BMP family ABC transporter substrate-binding protein [Methanoregulaceae archaeon]